MEAFGPLITDIGLPISILIFFMYRDWRNEKKIDRREELMGARINDLETFQKGELLDLIIKVTNVVSGSTQTQKDSMEAMNKIRETFENCPNCKRGQIDA